MVCSQFMHPLLKENVWLNWSRNLNYKMLKCDVTHSIVGFFLLCCTSPFCASTGNGGRIPLNRKHNFIDLLIMKTTVFSIQWLYCRLLKLSCAVGQVWQHRLKVWWSIWVCSLYFILFSNVNSSQNAFIILFYLQCQSWIMYLVSHSNGMLHQRPMHSFLFPLVISDKAAIFSSCWPQ